MTQRNLLTAHRMITTQATVNVRIPPRYIERPEGGYLLRQAHTIEVPIRTCEKCGGSDRGELTVECSNQLLTNLQKDLIKIGKLQYNAGRWIEQTGKQKP